MRVNTHAILAAAVGGVFALAIHGETFALQTRPAATAPATTTTTSTMPADATPLVATITSVKGAVEVRAAEGQPWQKAAVGMKIDQGAEIRTGLRSAVQFVVGKDQTITLDRLGTVTVLQAFESRGKAKTDLGLKYGRARYDIKKTDLEHESTIRSPGSTLAIRGTDVIYEDQAPWVPRAISRKGRAEFRNYRRQFVAFGGNKRAAVSAESDSPADEAIAATRADPRGVFAGRTASEEELVITLQSIGGFDAKDARALAAGFQGFGGTIAAVPDVPGPLDFQLAWQSVSQTPGPTNINLSVTDPSGATATALNPTIGTGSSTGMHMGDDMGASGVGAENVAWGLFFPAGTYTVTANHAGGDDAQIFIQAFQGQSAEAIKAFGTDPAAPIVLKPGESFSGTVTAQPTNSRSARQKAARLQAAPRRNRR